MDGKELLPSKPEILFTDLTLNLLLEQSKLQMLTYSFILWLEWQNQETLITIQE